MASGWQQLPKCIHIGLFGAALTIGGQPVGGTWKCVCGKVFVVKMVDGHKKLVDQ